MNNCGWCNLSQEEKRFQVYESAFWSVFPADEQDYTGRCILVLKRHCGSLAELSDEEWEDLRDLIRKTDYKEAEPDPHLHIHVRPRYDRPLVIHGNTYIDSEFGHHYALHKNGSIPAEDREEVFKRMKEWMNR